MKYDTVKLSELIFILQQAKEENGDIGVRVDGGEGPYKINIIHPISYENGNIVLIGDNYGDCVDLLNR